MKYACMEIALGRSLSRLGYVQSTIPPYGSMAAPLANLDREHLAAEAGLFLGFVERTGDDKDSRRRMRRLDLLKTVAEHFHNETATDVLDLAETLAVQAGI